MRCKTVSLHHPNRRGAVLSMELVLVLPLFLLLIFSLIEFSLLTAGQARVASAAQAGARYMSLSGAEESAVQARVAQVLGSDLSVVCSIAVQPAK
jgi:Flp pilus assembly protein TadG